MMVDGGSNEKNEKKCETHRFSPQLIPFGFHGGNSHRNQANLFSFHHLVHVF